MAPRIVRLASPYMTIYSWNMLFRNAELDRAFDFISKAAFDIFCLQEVPEAFLERVRALPCHLTYRVGVERLFTSGSVKDYNIILSKHPIEAYGEIPLPNYWPHLSWRSRFFVRLMRPFGFSKIKDRGGVYADIRMPGALVRVYCLHLILGNPAWRVREFETAMAERIPKRPTIVCGDFNILESRRVSLLNWIFDGRFSDALFVKRERTHIEQRFAEHALQNALRGATTHAFSRSQLDHILVSHEYAIKNARVIRDTYGSDHNPIVAEVA